MGEVVVADADGIGVSEGLDAGLRRGPGPDAWSAEQDAVHTLGVRCGEEGADKRGASRGDPRDRAGLRRLEPGAVPLPRRDAPPAVDGRGCEHRSRRRSGSPRPVAGHDPSPGAERLEARDLLFEHRADERIEDEIGAAQAQAGMTMREVGDQRMLRRLEPAGVVGPSAQRRHLIEGPLGALAPRRGSHRTVRAAPEGECRHTQRSAACAPDHRAGRRHRRVVRSASLEQHCGGEVQGVSGPVDSLDRMRRPCAGGWWGCRVRDVILKRWLTRGRCRGPCRRE